MSEENGKVCCNCRHNKRTQEKTGIECHCEIDNHYIGYIECMQGWCRHWARLTSAEIDETLMIFEKHRTESEVTEC